MHYVGGQPPVSVLFEAVLIALFMVVTFYYILVCTLFFTHT